MRQSLPLALLVLGALNLFASGTKAQPPDRPAEWSTEKSLKSLKPHLRPIADVVLSFISAVNQADLKKAATYVAGTEVSSKPGAALDEIEQEMKGIQAAFSITSLNIPPIEEDKKVVQVGLQLSLINWPDKEIDTGRLVLSFAGDTWKIVPGEPGLLIKPLHNNILLYLATLAAYPNELKKSRARDEARRTVCVANIKQLAVAAIIFAQQHDGKLTFPAAGYKESLMPYTKSALAFLCPAKEDFEESYSFNSKLLGIDLEAIAAPAEVVMFYEGKDGVLDFQHTNGLFTTVAFADGHVKLISAEQAKKLRWNP